MLGARESAGGAVARLRRTSVAAAGDSVREVVAALRLFDVRAWTFAILGGMAVAILIGVPTEIIGNPWFTRMTPVRPQDYAVWSATALLSGLVAGTFALRTPASLGEKQALSGGALSYLAVGCPICNKLVVLLLGTSGALTFFEPLQLYLGLGSLGLLLWTLRLRARSVVGSCRLGAGAI